MAEKKKKKQADFKARDGNLNTFGVKVKKPDKKVKKETRKPHQSTFGQKVQKLETENKEQAGSDVFSEEKTFTGEKKESHKSKNETFGQIVQKSGEEQKADYHRRDTYRQSQKKTDVHRKRVQKEQGSRKERNKTFTGNNKNDFSKDSFNNDSRSEFIGSDKLKRKQKQAEKAAEKVRRAREKLPKKREYTLKRVFDEKTGKAKYVIVPLEIEKPYRPDGITKKALYRVQMEGRNFIHDKIAENEKENAAVEGFHKIEQCGEDLFAFVYRQYRGREYRQRKKVANLEKKQFKKEVNFRYQKFLEENPQIKKKTVQKRVQKHRIKREYLKARQKKAATKTAQEAIFKSNNVLTVAARKLQEIARRNISVFIMAGIIALLLLMIMTSMVSCGAMFTGTKTTILASSYLSEPKEIDAADLQFTRLELDLQKKIDNIEIDYPGYDEYLYDLGKIGHDPFVLISYLSAVHIQFTANEVAGDIQELFNEMYELTTTSYKETRTRTVTNSNGQTSQEKYEVTILKVVLTVKPLESIVAAKMNAEQKETCGVYMETGGLLQQFASPIDLYWYNHISSYYGYRKNPNTGTEELHRGVDIALPIGTTVYASHDGVVTDAAYDNYYGNYVVIEKDGYTTKYAHMDSFQVNMGQKVKKGDVIGKSGNSGKCKESHLHIECLYNGKYYNPLFYFDVEK